jgi:hypothetical protein
MFMTRTPKEVFCDLMTQAMAQVWPSVSGEPLFTRIPNSPICKRVYVAYIFTTAFLFFLKRLDAEFERRLAETTLERYAKDLSALMYLDKRGPLRAKIFSIHCQLKNLVNSNSEIEFGMGNTLVKESQQAIFDMVELLESEDVIAWFWAKEVEQFTVFFNLAQAFSINALASCNYAFE